MKIKSDYASFNSKKYYNSKIKETISNAMDNYQSMAILDSSIPSRIVLNLIKLFNDYKKISNEEKNDLKVEIDNLKKEIERLKNRNLIQRIFNN